MIKFESNAQCNNGSGPRIVVIEHADKTATLYFHNHEGAVIERKEYPQDTQAVRDALAMVEQFTKRGEFPAFHGYIAFFNGKKIEVYAESIYAAKVKATAVFKPAKSKSHLVSVHLCEKDGEQVTHSTASL